MVRRVARQPTDLLCLSSGLTVRYRQDILRALALPFQAHVQFRYSRDIVDASLTDGLQRDAMAGSVALLAHVDCVESSKRDDGSCFITPCRRAVLTSSRRIGDYYVLVFRLWGYATSSDLEGFQRTIPNERPRWNGGSLSGLWCLPTIHGQGWQQTFGLEGFQHVARDMHRRRDFADQQFFFAVEGISQRGDPHVVSPKSQGETMLPAGKHFDLRVFHFAPTAEHTKSSDATGAIRVDLTSPLEAVTSATLMIDSPYDLKSFAFRTSDKVAATQSAAIVLRATKGSDGKEVDPSQPEVHLPVRVEMSIAKSMVQIGVLTVLLFLQQYVTASSRGLVSVSVTVMLFLLALLTAGFAVLALKRPF
jgi:hypothetical protein